MIQSLSSNITDQLVKNGIIVLEEKEIYSYGLQRGFTMVINILLSLVIGLVLGMPLESIIFMVAYIPLRSYAGGYHARTQFTCHILSLVIIVVALLAIKFISWTNTFSILLLLISGSLICFLSPVPDSNKPLNEKEIKAYKKNVILILGGQYICIFLLVLLQQKEGLESIMVSQMALSGMLVLGKVKKWRYG